MVKTISDDSGQFDVWAATGSRLDPTLDKTNEGWQLGEQPPHQYHNTLQYTRDAKINYILQRGVSKWLATTDYDAGDFTVSTVDDGLYRALTDTLNEEPSDSPYAWERVGFTYDEIVLLIQTAIDAIPGGSMSGVITAGENISDRDVIYKDVDNARGNGADRWYLVDTDATAPVCISSVIGVALEAITSGNTGEAAIRKGEVDGFTGLTAGGKVWASATAGGYTQTEPAVPADSTQNATRLIGTALNTTTIEFDPSGETVFVARKSLTHTSTVTIEHWADSGARERQVGAYQVDGDSTSLVSGGTGTNIGSLTAQGGLAAAFDGNTSQNNSQAAVESGDVPASYVGKTYSPGKRVSGIQAWPTNAAGWDIGGGSSSITLELYGKTGSAPASSTDGTLLGSTVFNNDTSPRSITSSDSDTVWDHVWLRIRYTGGSTATFACAELQITEVLATYDCPEPVFSELRFAASTDKVTCRFDDGVNAGRDTNTTFINRTNGTLDLAFEVIL